MSVRRPDLPPLSTTVVGSFPAAPDRDRLLASYRTDQDPFLESIRESVEAQVSAGIEIITDGQTRNDMIKLFTTELGGIRMKLKPVVIGQICFKGAITIKDQEYVRSIAGEGRLLKGVITGPFTLASTCIDEHYGSREKLAFAFAEALNREARLLDGVVDIVQVDEPFFSVEFPEYASDIISTVFSGLGKPRAMHVCGDVSGIFGKLVDFQVDILDHEFAAHPELLDVVADVNFDQTIGLGCVRADVNEVESVSTISERIKKGKDCIGDNKLLLDPDCGLRHVSGEVARQKLVNMVKARNVIRDEG